MLEMTKRFQEHREKKFAENFLSSKPTEFDWRGINKPPDKWQEVIQNNSEYTIDWN